MSSRTSTATASSGLREEFLADLERDQRKQATMSMLIPPQMLNTIAPQVPASSAGYTDAWYADPVRRYMLPVFSDRQSQWPSHPYAQRDSLHEAQMWAVEGLTHRYRTAIEQAGDELTLRREYPYYDPIHLLPADGQLWWRAPVRRPELRSWR